MSHPSQQTARVYAVSIAFRSDSDAYGHETYHIVASDEFEAERLGRIQAEGSAYHHARMPDFNLVVTVQECEPPDPDDDPLPPATAGACPVCPKCGSDDIVSYACARWDPVRESWSLTGTYDNETCQACGAEGDAMTCGFLSPRSPRPTASSGRWPARCSPGVSCLTPPSRNSASTSSIDCRLPRRLTNGVCAWRRQPEPPSSSSYHSPRRSIMEFGRYVVLSTAHVRCATAVLLTAWAQLPAAAQPLAVASTQYGWFLATRVVAKNGDFPDELHAILTFGRAHGCDYVLLDSDGEQTEALPVFPW